MTIIPVLFLLCLGFQIDRSVAAETLLPASVGERLVITGVQRLSGNLTVQKEGVLILEKGSRIRAEEGATMTILGTLEVKGVKGEQVIIASVGEGKWKGINFLSGSSGTITGLDLSGATAGISIIAAKVDVSDSVISRNEKGIYLVREASASLDGIKFDGNRMGVAAEMKSTGTISRCTFRKNDIGIGVVSGARPVISMNRFEENGFGIQAMQRFPESIRENLFENNDIAARLYQNGPDTVVERNIFVNNTTGAIMALSYSSPTIFNNRIEGGKYGILANQFSSPTIRNNVIIGLEEGVHLNKKNSSTITGNIFSDSAVGLFLDFSSYPIIRDNLFDENRTNIKLGKFQSSHWEASAGSKKFVMQTASKLGSRNPKLAQGPEQFPESVDATGNAWDEDTTAQMEKNGDDANISTLYDGHDLPEVTYEGFGEQKYRVDRILFEPWLEDPPTAAGLTGWKGRADELDLP
jgi:parallel beta-helix repeat protein